MTGGANVKSLTLGGLGSTPQLIISSQSANTNLDAQPAGATIAAGASVTLTCPASPGECSGGPGGGAGFYTGSSPLNNAGTIKVDANSGDGAVVGGAIINTGTIAFENTLTSPFLRTASLSGVIVNQGAINISSGGVVVNSGSSCGDTGASVKNDTGGTITANGTGLLSVINYEQGNGSVGGTSAVPINIPCGSLKYSGNGASKVQATGGFNLSGGEMQLNQSLTVLGQSANTNAVLKTDLTNKGSITLSCSPPGGPPPPVTGCSGGDSGGAGFNVAGHQFTNEGTFTVAAASGDGATIDSGTGGTITNTGTMQFDQSARLLGTVVNKGSINIANGKAVSHSGGGSCNSDPAFKNDTGGSINATGTGALFTLSYEQGDGTATGANPVQMGGGCLKYSGNGASKVRVTGGFGLSGETQAGQSLTVSAEGAPNVNAILQGDFTNNGSITLTCTAACGPEGGVGFNGAGHDFTNTGTFTVAAASGTGANIDSGTGGTITNTGTMQFDQTARLNGVITNKGPINIANGKVVTTNGGCGGGPVKNETGGSINATGTGLYSLGNYEQGDGTTTGANPVQMYGGCLKYTGNGASKVLVTGAFDLSGEMQSNQSLTLTNASNNTSLRLVSPFTSKGSITLTCPGPGSCSGPGFNGNGNLFTNAGTFTVDAAASSGSTSLDRSSGGITNALGGTFQFNGNTQFNGGGPFSNQGTLQIAAGVNNTPSFTNAGTIVLDQSATNPFLNTGTLTNTGTITTSGASANTSSINGTVDQTGASAQVIVPTGTKLSVSNPLALHAGRLSGGGTIEGTVDNQGGTVAPGASPGTLAIGNYSQGAGGTLEIEVAGTGAGQFDKLTTGLLSLDGTLALQPSAGYVASSALGDSIAFLTHTGALAGKEEFAKTTVNPSLACPKQFSVAYDEAAKAFNAVVSNSGAVCPGDGGGGGGGGGGVVKPPPPPSPNTTLGKTPKSKIKIKKGKAKVSFAFSSDVAGATFQCKLDKGQFAPCTSPKTYKVKPGKHTFTVQAVGPGGTDATPASFSFKVVKVKKKKKG